MKLVQMTIGLALAVASLQAEEPPANPAWDCAVLRAERQLKQGNFAEAAESGKQALAIARHFGSSDRRLASSYHLLGLIYREWRHCEESRSNFLHALAIRRTEPDVNPRYIYNSVAGLLTTLCECDNPHAAEKVMRSYQSYLQYGSGPLDDAKLLSIRAVLASYRKDYARSEALFRQSLEIMERENSLVEAMVQRSSLATVLYKEGRFAESLAESERAIEYLERAAPQHPALLVAINNAACALADMGRGDDAGRMFQRALSAAETLYGDDNRVTAKIMLSYAALLRANKQSGAADMQKRGSEAFRRSLTRDAATVDVEELRAGGK